ncbi:zinc ribbon domain-containing protein [Methanothrix soehngenii]|uniref:zinc ribbon domain-containing protein n=1 Tax=Methanothrix soehngenii TaxID=2223 RepID=UPI003FA53A41
MPSKIHIGRSLEHAGEINREQSSIRWLKGCAGRSKKYFIVKKDLSERVHSCSECGLSMDRDLNAAINILRLGMQSLRKSDRSPVL